MTKITHVETFGELAHLILEDGRVVCFRIEGVYKPEPVKTTLVLQTPEDPTNKQFQDRIAKAIKDGMRVTIE